ncbi:hypothetical protein TCAL_04486 [Tigriopus californicus]|uniref:Uncharacterized protein n=1 Tax=Tigriopus californicus TaxID=6832 RepID=A0A553NY86_TIGCA|nr:hypothetical protein TCAL_04486 [Tigriopus californicus]
MEHRKKAFMSNQFFHANGGVPRAPHHYPPHQAWSKSRSMGDLNRQPMSLISIQPRNTELYRVSRRRIIGTAMQEEDDFEWEEMLRQRRENWRRLQDRKLAKKQSRESYSSYTDSPSDEGVYLQGDSSGSDHSIRLQRRQSQRSEHAQMAHQRLSRYRSADPVTRGWVQVLPHDGSAQKVRNRLRGSFERDHRPSESSDRRPELESFDEGDTFMERYKLRIPVNRINLCSCEGEKNLHLKQQHTLCKSKSRDSSIRKKSLSQSNLVNIEELEEEDAQERVREKRSNVRTRSAYCQTEDPYPCSTKTERDNRRLSQKRLLKVASYHHLPRVSPVRQSSSASSSTTLKHHIQIRRSASAEHASTTTESNNDESSTNSIGPHKTAVITRRYIKNKQGRHRTTTVNIHDLFPDHPDNEAEPTPPETVLTEKLSPGKSASSIGSFGDDSGSDPGICLLQEEEGNSTPKSDSGQVSEVDSLDLEMQLFDLGSKERSETEESQDNETDLSLAYVTEAATIHSYIASRGQREREEEIYEVIPSMIPIQKAGIEPQRDRDLSSFVTMGHSTTSDRAELDCQP